MASVWAELKRRNVVKVAAAYAIVGWLLIEIVSTVLPTFDAPRWALQTITFAIILGFPLALIFAWAFEITPDGIKREKDVDPSSSITRRTGQKLNYAIIALLSLAVVFMVIDGYLLQGNAPASSDAPNTIAVLPFANESAAAENAEFFANGIHDEILTQLSRIASLKVISRTSVMEYRDTTKNLREIGAELGVATILEGRVQRAGDRVRINVQLISTDTDEHLWAEIYDRELTAENIFAIQSEMAVSIADELRATLTPLEVARLNEIPTRNTRAYDFYLSALQYHAETDRLTNLPLAIRQLEQAIEEDPAFALAFAKLSELHAFMYWLGFDADESRRATSLDTAQQAVALQSDLPEAHYALAYYYYSIAKNFDEALDELSIAEQGLPGNADVALLRSNIYKRTGRWEQALAETSRFVDLDPRNAQLLISAGANYFAARAYAEAERLFDRVLELVPDSETARILRAGVYLWGYGDGSLSMAYADDPTVQDPYRPVRGWLAAIYARNTELALRFLDNWDGEVDIGVGGGVYKPKSLYYGITYRLGDKPEFAESNLEAARALIERMIDENPEDFRFQLALAEILANTADHEGARRVADQAMEMMPPTRDGVAGRNVQSEMIIGVFAVIQDDERLLRELDDYLRHPGGFMSIEGLLPDPRLDFIRDDPRFVALVEKYKRR